MYVIKTNNMSFNAQYSDMRRNRKLVNFGVSLYKQHSCRCRGIEMSGVGAQIQQATLPLMT